MKLGSIKIKSKIEYNHLIKWGKLVSITGLSQIIVQVTSLVSGILIIRLLSIKEYALYTIANALLATMTLLADSGISTGVMAQAGLVWKDKEKLGRVLNTGLYLRKKFAIASMIVAIPFFTFLAWKNDNSFVSIFLIVCSLIPAFWAALSDSLLETVLKLHQDIKALQKNQIVVAILRFSFTAILFLFPFSMVAMLATGIPRIYGNRLLKSKVSLYTERSGEIDKNVEVEIKKIVKRSLPEILYYCFSGQITIWLLSIFGNSKSLADSGALGRLGAILNIASSLISILIIPRFARLVLDKKILSKHVLRILGGVVLLCIVFELLGFVFSKQILWVLGPKYAMLNKELLVFIGVSSTNLLIGTVFGLYASKGWIMKPIISIPFNIVSLILGMIFFDLTSLINVLWFSMFTNALQLILHLSFITIKIREVN